MRKVALVSLASAGSEERLENCLACLTNLGDIHIFTVPGLRPQVHYGCIRKEDISGIASCVFTKHGQGEGTSPALGVMSLIDGTLSLAAAPRRGSLRLFVVPPPTSRFLPNFAVRVRALLAERQERDGAVVPARSLPAPGHLLPQVGRAPGTRWLCYSNTPLPPPHGTGSGSNFSPPPPRFLPATARRRRRSCRRRTAPTSRAAPRADAPPPTATVSDHPIPAVHTAFPPPPLGPTPGLASCPGCPPPSPPVPMAPQGPPRNTRPPSRPAPSTPPTAAWRTRWTPPATSPWRK